MLLTPAGLGHGQVPRLTRAIQDQRANLLRDVMFVSGCHIMEDRWGHRRDRYERFARVARYLATNYNFGENQLTVAFSNPKFKRWIQKTIQFLNQGGFLH